MDLKWKLTIVIAALLCVASGLCLPGPFISRAEAVFRYIPIDSGDPDDVYWASAPPPPAATEAAATPPACRPHQDSVTTQEHRELARIARILSIILLRP